ncbi:MAG: hypothetical protein HQM11_12770 [SAR324 cluster bacterium]|nr:hypothetical protein [SAR324 cluster bacterium]
MLSDRVVMMTNGPRARVGDVLEITLPRPRVRAELLENGQYYQYREHLLTFLEECEKLKKPPVFASKAQTSTAKTGLRKYLSKLVAAEA